MPQTKNKPVTIKGKSKISDTELDLILKKYAKTIVFNYNQKFYEIEPLLIYDAVSSGIEARVFNDFARAVDMPEKQLGIVLHINPRTIKTYVSEKKKLAKNSSEHLLKLIDLYKTGEKLFGSTDQFNKWLKKPSWNGMGAPESWLDTQSGIQMAKDELIKMMEAYPL